MRNYTDIIMDFNNTVARCRIDRASGRRIPYSWDAIGISGTNYDLYQVNPDNEIDPAGTKLMIIPKGEPITSNSTAVDFDFETGTSGIISLSLEQGTPQVQASAPEGVVDTPFNNEQQRIIALENGNALLYWIAKGDDGTFQHFLQIFDRFSKRVGSEVRIPGTSLLSLSPSFGSGYSIAGSTGDEEFIQFYNGTSEALTSRLPVSSGLTSPTVLGLTTSQNTSLALFQSGSNLYGRKFKFGSATTEDILITDKYAGGPVKAVASGDNFIISSNTQPSGTSPDIQRSVSILAGNNTVSEDIIASTSPLSSSTATNTLLKSPDGTVVAWTSADGSSNARLVNNSGVLGPVFPVHSSILTPSTDSRIVIETLPDGRLLSTYNNNVNGIDVVMAQFINPKTGVASAAFQVSSNDHNSYITDISILANGNIIATYNIGSSGYNAQYARTINSNGTVTEPEFTITSGSLVDALHVLPQTVALATPPGESQGGSESESIIFSTFQARNRTLGRDVVVGVAQSNTGYFVTKCDVVNITEIPTTTPATTSTTTTPVITTPTPTPSETPTQTPCPPLKLDPIPNQKSKVNEDYYINLSEYISLVDGQSFEQTLTSLRELEGSDPENVFHIRKGLNNEYLLTSSKPINITLQALFTYCAGQIMQELNFNVNVTDSKTPITPGPDDSYKFDPNYLALLSLIVPLATLLYCLNKHCRQREEDNQNQVEGDGQPMTADTFSNQEEEKQEEGITDQANINQQQVEMLGLDPHSPYSPSIQSPSAIDPDFEQPEQDPSATFHLRGTPTSILENEEDKGQTLS